MFLGGKCTEYNVFGAVVQEHVRLSCANFEVPCPNFYRSDEAYRCKFIFAHFRLGYGKYMFPVHLACRLG